MTFHVLHRPSRSITFLSYPRQLSIKPRPWIRTTPFCLGQDQKWRETWLEFSDYLLEEGMYPTATTFSEAQSYPEKKKAILSFARSHEELLLSIPEDVLHRLASIEPIGKYERKVNNAFRRLNRSYGGVDRESAGADRDRASFQDVMRLILRASELDIKPSSRSTIYLSNLSDFFFSFYRDL